MLFACNVPGVREKATAGTFVGATTAGTGTGATAAGTGTTEGLLVMMFCLFRNGYHSDILFLYFSIQLDKC